MIPKISFLILTYNSENFVDSLMDSILTRFKEKIITGEYEILIIDNKSQDNTISKFRQYFDHQKLEYDYDKRIGSSIFIYSSSSNLGYAKGINKISSFAKGQVLVVINPDAVLIDGDFDKLHEEFEKEKMLAVAGLKVIGNNLKPEKTAGNFYNIFTFIFFSLGLEDFVGLRYSPERKLKVDFVSGGFIAFDSKKFKDLNGYDEDYFMYVEDMDICYRANKKGFEVKFIPYATIKHQGQGSSNRTFAIVNIYKGLQIFYRKHGEVPLFLVKYLLRLKAFIIILGGAITGNKKLISTYREAIKSIK